MGDGRGYLVLREIIREKTKKKTEIRGKLQACGEREKKERRRCRVVGAESAEMGDRSYSESSLLLYLEILRWCLVCRPSNRQIHMGGWRIDSRGC